jgi:hypothetical protein
MTEGQGMSAVRPIEHEITRRLMARSPGRASRLRRPLVERVIRSAAIVIGTGLLYLYLREVFWALFLAASVLTLGSRSGS